MGSIEQALAIARCFFNPKELFNFVFHFGRVYQKFE